MGVLSGSRHHIRNSTRHNIPTGESFKNLVQRLETFAQAHLGVAIEVFMFTESYITECVYFRGTSSSTILFDLVLLLCKLELHAG
jgi:hypothetical protein